VGVLEADNAANQQGFIESGPGESLTTVLSPLEKASDLSGVSCVSATFCMAVGHYEDVTIDAIQPLTEMWNGTTWTFVPSPSTSVATPQVLNAVSCVSPTSCMAVGDGLIESWNGTAWSLSSNPDASDGNLAGISCTSPTACIAVGNTTSGGTKTLIESFDAGTWSVLASPNASNTDPFSSDFLTGVSCITSTYCVAVGQYTDLSAQPLIYGKILTEVLDGSSWSILPSADPAGTDGLSGVSCIATSVCLAVGIEYPIGSGGPDQTLIEMLLGGTWTVRESPNTPTPGVDNLVGISCASVTSCVAVGTQFGAENENQTLVEALQPVLSS